MNPKAFDQYINRLVFGDELCGTIYRVIDGDADFAEMEREDYLQWMSEEERTSYRRWDMERVFRSSLTI